MVELRHVRPFPGRVAGQASGRLARAIAPVHALCELAFMNVVMTTCAAQLREVKHRDG